ncbi:hypothetical protein A5853_002491 [Enterococcus faecium]|jgi:hypothetical protein|nr:hypothetical protein OGS_02828 [Enterococcus faecium EnGen0002]OTO82705.1 hypothetical protein A5847_002605 [Enterococcus faecium]OTO90324.1 hypothetical protein A5853_002491 [Enterococcus faecium]OUZ27975.1 hypothetical protein A5806_002584 [Enterococcus faecium]
MNNHFQWLGAIEYEFSERGNSVNTTMNPIKRGER